MDNQPTYTEPTVIETTPTSRVNPFFMGIGAIVIFGLGLLGGYFLFGNKPQQSPELTNQQSIQASPTTVQKILSPTEDETAMWKTYQNSRYVYSVKYPDTWNIKEQDYFDEMSSIFSSGTNNIFTFHGSVPARGCGQTDSANNKTASVQLGNKTVTIQNFCGTNTYRLDAQNSSGKILTIDVAFIDTPFESDGREALKSVEGITAIQK